MSVNNLTIDGEFRYIIQWFNEWSELQRDDFLPIFMEYINKDNSNGVYLNGIVMGLAGTGCNDKPMSLFQCRIKLFREWSAKWPELMKNKLKEKLIELDPSFATKLNEEIDTLSTDNNNESSRTQPTNNIHPALISTPEQSPSDHEQQQQLFECQQRNGNGISNENDIEVTANGNQLNNLVTIEINNELLNINGSMVSPIVNDEPIVPIIEAAQG